MVEALAQHQEWSDEEKKLRGGSVKESTASVSKQFRNNCYSRGLQHLIFMKLDSLHYYSSIVPLFLNSWSVRTAANLRRRLTSETH